MTMASLLPTSFECQPLIDGLGNFLEVCQSRTPSLLTNNLPPGGHSRFGFAAISRVSGVH